MANFKFVKSATALVLGASVLTTAVVVQGADASAKTTYKVTSKGTLVNAKTNKAISGYKSYKGKLYYNGKKFTGLYNKKYYYKYGVKATGTYKGAYYYKGSKKVTSGTYNGAYYYKGVKKVTTGLYNGHYYKNGVKATGTYKGAYYYKGYKKVTSGTYNGAYYYHGVKSVTTGLFFDHYYKNGVKATGTYQGAYYYKGYKKVTTGTYNGAYYVDGVKKVATGTYDKAYYVDGEKVVETGLYDSKFYKDGVLNVGLALFADKLYNGAEENKGLVKFEDKYYFDTTLANDTYLDNGVEKAFEDGVEVGAKVKSVEAINATQVKVTFNKTVSESAAEAVDGSGVSTVVKLGGSTLKTPELSEDGRTLILTATAAINADNATVEVEPIATKADANVKTVRYASLITYKDVIAPTVASTEKVNYTTVKVKFSEPVQSQGTWTYKDKDGNTQTATVTGFDGTSVKLAVDPTKVVAGSAVTFTGINISDVANNLITPNPVSVNFTVGAQDTVAPTVSSITQTGGKKFEITFDKAVSAGTVTVNGAATTVAPKTTGAITDTTFVVTTTTSLNDAQTVAVSGFANADGTSMAAYSKVVAFQKDAVAPTVTASKLVTVGTTKYAQLTFDKEVTDGLVSVSGSYVKDYVTTAVSSITATAIYPTGDTTRKVLLVPVAGFASVDGAKYDLTVSSTAVKNDSDVPMASASVSFTLDSTQDTNENVFAASDITLTPSLTNPSVITVDFGTYTPDGASATAASNYKVNGQTVKSVKLTDSNTAELTLNPGQVTVSGTYNVTVSGVKVKNSTKVMDAVTKPVASLSENVAPTIKSTILKDNGTAAVNGTATVSGPDASKAVAGTATAATGTHTTTYTVADNAGTLEVSDGSSVVTTLDASGNGSITQDGVAITITGAADTNTFTVATTAATTATGATITLTASESLNTTVASDAFEVYAGSTKLDLAASNAITISGNTITIKLAGSVTSAQLATGLTVKPTANNNVKDSVGNALDISATGVQVAQ